MSAYSDFRPQKVVFVDRVISIATLYRCARGALREARTHKGRALEATRGQYVSWSEWSASANRFNEALRRVASYRARIAELRAS